MKDLFGNEELLPPGARKVSGERIAIQQYKQLISMYGKTPGKKCGACVNCVRQQYSKAFYKCILAKISSSQATDWNSRWDACGKFEKQKK